jgi:hypothetical protein
VIAQIYNVTGGIHRHVDMILPRIFDLSSGEVTMRDIVTVARSRLMTE